MRQAEDVADLMDGHLEGNTSHGCSANPGGLGLALPGGQAVPGAAWAGGGNFLRRRGSGLDSLLPTLPFALSPRSAATTHLEEADAHVAGGQGEVLIIVKVNITQAPGVCKLLPDAIEHPRTAQVPAWPERGGAR